MDLATQALREAGALGVGQTALADDISDAIMRLQWMLQQWERKRWLVYHTVDFAVTCTGAQSYSIGPGGDLDTNQSLGPFNNQFNGRFAGTYPVSVRPAKIESAFIRQLNLTQPNQVDFPLRLLHAREDYNRIALKRLSTFPAWLFYDPAWPLGTLYPWPVPQANIYALHVMVLEQLPPMFASPTVVLQLPYEYLSAIVLNLAMRLRPKYAIPTFPGDPLPGLAREALKVVRATGVQVSQLQIPGELMGGEGYNIFSDRFY